jgi:triacylglycerol lipase
MRNTILTFAIFFLITTPVLAQKNQPCHRDGPLAGNCGFGPLSEVGPNPSLIAPLKPNDTRFVENSGNGLDTGCTFRPGGPLVISLPVTRVVGANGNGSAISLEDMKHSGVLSKTAKLRLPAFDVDLEGAPGVPPELDLILFNGVQIGSLSGSNETWKMNEFEIPIELVHFATINPGGGAPTPGNNTITILIDQGSGSDVNWCTSIDWVELTFQTISPVILVHGNGQSGQFFVNTGFVSYLQSRGIPYDNSISLETRPIYFNAFVLDEQLPGIVQKFGVDSIHLVAHSKGGLDSRAYIQIFRVWHPEFKILSLNTMGSPHDGTLLTDLQELRAEAATRVGKFGKIEYEGFPLFIRQMLAIAKPDDGLKDLTTKKVATFNSFNVPTLGNLFITTVGGDADVNGNARIDRFPDEYAGLRSFDLSLQVLDVVNPELGRHIIDAMYQVLRNTSSITMSCCRTTITGRRIAKITATPSSEPILNDTLVTIPSATGSQGGLFNVTVHSRAYTGAAGRNHANIADADVASQLVTWILEVERDRGDLKPQ